MWPSTLWPYGPLYQTIRRINASSSPDFVEIYRNFFGTPEQWVPERLLICCRLFAKQLSLGADYTAGLQDEAIMSLVDGGRFNDDIFRNFCWNTRVLFSPPASETSSVGRVVPWSRSAHRRQSSSWLLHKLLIQLLQTSTNTTMGPCQVATGNDYHPYEDMWMDRIKCSSPSPPLSSHLSQAPTVLYLFQFPPTVPFTTVKRKCVDLRRCSHPARPSAFSRLNEETNEWISLSLFTETLWVLRSCRGNTERNHSRQNISMESWCFESAGTTSIRLSPGTFACRHVLQVHLWTIKKCLYWKRSAIFHNAALPSYIIPILWAATGRKRLVLRLLKCHYCR